MTKFNPIDVDKETSNVNPRTNNSLNNGTLYRPTRWCFTWNNPEDNYADILREWYESDVIKYGVCQLEEGEETNTKHLQGYVEFKKQKTLAGCKKLIKQAHWAPAAADGETNRKYCTKEETRKEGPWEWGTLERYQKVFWNQ